MSPLAWFVCVIVGSIGYGAGVYRYERHGKREWAAGYEQGADDCAIWSSDAYIFRCDLPRGHNGPHEDTDDKGTVSWNDEFMATRPLAPVRPVPEADGPARPDPHDGRKALPPAVPAPVPLPAAGERDVSGYDLDHPAPAGFYPELAALEDLPRPSPAAGRAAQMSGLATMPDAEPGPGEAPEWAPFYARYVRLGEDMSWWFRAAVLGVAEEWERFSGDLASWSAKVAAS